MKTLCLTILSFVWSVVNLLMRALVRYKILRSVSLPVRVVSIGNIQAGGAGKTPLLIYLAREAVARGLRVGVLTRGYRSLWELTGGEILPKVHSQYQRPEVKNCGDEALLIHELVPDAWIGVGANRIDSFQRLQRYQPFFDLVLLDDGFQYWKIKKDLEIVVLTPRKRSELVFRDFDSALAKADLIVFNKGGSFPANFPKRPQPVTIRMNPKLELIPLRQKKCYLVSGIGDPQFLENTLKQQQVDLCKHICCGDHYDYTLDEIKHWIQDAKQYNATLCITGKDWVKWKGLGIRSEEVVVLEPSIEFEEGPTGVFEKMLWDVLPRKSHDPTNG